MPLFLSLFFSLTTLFIGPFLNLNLISILLFSASLSFSDFIRAKILTGFSWNLWAYSFSWSSEILQILNKIGLFTFNLILITMFTIPAVLFFGSTLSKKTFPILFVAIIFLIFYVFGSHTINQNKIFLDKFNDKFNVKVISPNFDLEYGLEIEDVENRLIKLIRYSEPNDKIKTLFYLARGCF